MAQAVVTSEQAVDGREGEVPGRPGRVVEARRREDGASIRPSNARYMSAAAAVENVAVAGQARKGLEHAYVLQSAPAASTIGAVD